MLWHALLDGPFVFQAFVGATPLALIDVIARRAALIRPAATAVQHVRSKER